MDELLSSFGSVFQTILCVMLLPGEFIKLKIPGISIISASAILMVMVCTTLRSIALDDSEAIKKLNVAQT